MHFTLFSLTILLASTRAVPLDEENVRARPFEQFFKNVLNVFRPTTTPSPPPRMNVTEWISYAQSLQTMRPELQEIPNFVDFSTYFLDSLASNNTAIKFSQMQPNATSETALRRNYSVISFVVPNDEVKQESNSTKGVFSFLSSFRLPWSRPPSDTDYSQFPPFLEYFQQRIQAYYSVYKYPDDSRQNSTIVFPLKDDELLDDNPTTHQNDNSINALNDEGDVNTSNLDTTTEWDEATTTGIVNEME